MNQPLECADVRLDFVILIAEHALPVRGVHHRAGLEVPVVDAFLRARERQRQPLLALAQRRLGALALGQIEMRADNAHHRSAGFAADRQTARQDVHVVAVLVTQTELGLIRPLAARDRGVERARALVVVRVQQPFPGADVRLDLVAPRSRASASSAPSTRRRPVSRFQSHTPSCAPAKASDSRSSLSRRAASVRLRSVMSRMTDSNRAAVRILEQGAGDFDVGDRAVESDRALFVHRHAARRRAVSRRDREGGRADRC